MKRFLLLAFLSPLFIQANEKEIESKLESATIFFLGAQLNRTASIDLQPGTYALVLSNIENNIDNNSIQVRGNGNYLIKSYFTRRNYLQNIDYSDEIRKLEDEHKTLVLKNEDLNIDKSVFNDEANMILANQKLGGQNTGVDIEQLKQTSLFYQTRLKEIRMGILETDREQKKIRKKQQRITNQINQLRSFKQTSVNQLVINIEVEKATPCNFEISYYVPNASWTPFYEVMVDEINKPINIVYKANVNQNTGIDWSNIDITLSTTQPNLSGQVPSLSPWYLSFYNPNQYRKSPSIKNNEIKKLKHVVGSGASGLIRGQVLDGETGEPLPFASVVARDANGNTVNGATTDYDGKYSFNVNQRVFSLLIDYIGYSRQVLPINGNLIDCYLYSAGQTLDEIRISSSQDAVAYNNYQALDDKLKTTVYKPSTLSQKATFFEYHITTPYTIPSNNLTEVVHIRDVEVNAHYEYQSVPKLDKDVFLIAQIYGWEEYHLLNGSARLYFEKTFVGESYLNVELTDDTLGLSLGRDKNIIVSRDKVFDQSGLKSFSGNKKEVRQFEIQVRNNKSDALEVVVRDQYPLAKDKKINVKLDESSEAIINEKYGYLTWKIKLNPSSSAKRIFKYTVTFPADYHINIGE